MRDSAYLSVLPSLCPVRSTLFLSRQESSSSCWPGLLIIVMIGIAIILITVIVMVIVNNSHVLFAKQSSVVGSDRSNCVLQ